ncbi:MAG: hypothetical protein N3G80_02870 [Candidatus Micrarchaeota archaeon]|nr:hypothetical protein [Candidatus Micrarchaeota archaeon]
MDFVDQIIQVKKPTQNLISSLAEQYSQIAFKFGYFEAQSPCWLYFLRKDGSSAAFEVQFGNVSEFKASLAKLVSSKANLCFFVTSSLAHTLKLEETRGLLLRNFELGQQKFVLIDIENGRAIKVNFEWENFQKNIASASSSVTKQPPAPLFRPARRKKLIGRRGQHKEQD